MYYESKSVYAPGAVDCSCDYWDSCVAGIAEADAAYLQNESH